LDNDNNIELSIGPEKRADEIMRMYPETTDYFVDLGVCGCGFDGKFGKLEMMKTLKEIAREKHISLEEMLKKIKNIAGL